MQFARIVFRGQNVPSFEKKGPFGFYLGVFRGHFSNSTKNFPQKSWFRGKFESNITRNSRLGGVFRGEGKSRLGYVLKTSGHACVQHLYLSGPPGVGLTMKKARGTIKLVSDYLAAHCIAARSRDHRLPFQSYSSQRHCRCGLFTERRRFQVE